MNLKQKLWMNGRGPGIGIMLLLLFGLISVFLCGIYLPDTILFSNDGPLARLVMECHQLPGRFRGCWDDLYAVGYSEGAATPTLSSGLFWLLGPVSFSKFYAPTALLILGLGAWTFFRQAGLGWAACLLGGIAASLNSDLFSTACWGVAAHPIVVGMAFFAMAALWDMRSGRRWLRLVLGGLAVGMAVAEGADIGALFSLVVAGFLAYQALTQDGPILAKLPLGAIRIGVVAVVAAFPAAECVYQVFVTDVEGVVAGTEDQQSQSPEARWDWATEWSLPKVETLSLFVPGLFGYRMDYPDGGTYWGAIGRNAEWDRYFAGDQQGPRPVSLIRYTGGSNYAGVVVVLVGLWAVIRSLRREGTLFDLPQRRWIWFWAGLSVISVLLAYGRFGPFYHLLFHLPLFSTMRNPTKFLHIVSMASVVLFAYGVDGLWRGYLAAPAAAGRGRPGGLSAEDRWWIFGWAGVLVIILGGWWAYARSGSTLEAYLQTVGFRDFQAEQVVSFSVGQIGWFVLLYALSAGLLSLILVRFFTGQGGRWAVLGLGMILIADFWHGDEPWVIYWNYASKYASNPVIDLLKDKPYEHRVTLLPTVLPPNLRALERIYRIEWIQQTMPYYNIQSADIVQLSRRPTDLVAFQEIFESGQEREGMRLFGRHMELTNTRYVFSLAAYLDKLKTQLDPGSERVRIVARFDIVPKPGLSRASRAEEMTAALNPDGQFALFEYTGVLARARLYDHWQTETNDHEVLQQLVSPAFHPQQTVFVSSPLPAAAASDGTNGSPGRAEISRYTSRQVDIKTEASTATVLLLNDRFAPGWQVWVDGRRETLLRCNYIMRGVYLGAGPHTVSFQFHPRVQYFYTSVTAVGVAVILLAYLGVGFLRQTASSLTEPPRARPAASRPKAAADSKVPAGNGRGRKRK